MKCKIYFLITVFLILGHAAFSQKFKGAIIGGMSTSQIDGDTQKGFDKLGFFAGVSVATDFTQVIGIKSELYYIGKGAKNNIDGVELFKTKLHYVEMPFYLTIKPISRLEFDLGVAASYLISSKLYEYKEEIPEGLVEMHNLDFTVNISAIYYFSKSLGANIRTDYSLLSVKTNSNWHNSNLSLGIVYKINTAE